MAKIEHLRGDDVLERAESIIELYEKGDNGLRLVGFQYIPQTEHCPAEMILCFAKQP